MLNRQNHDFLFTVILVRDKIIVEDNKYSKERIRNDNFYR